MYTGKVILNNQRLDRIFDLMSIAKALELSSMSEELSLLLSKNLNVENVALIYERACLLDRIQLMSFCEHFIDQNVGNLLAQKSLVKMPGECLQRLIARDSFNLHATQVVELVKEWHVYHNHYID